MERCLVLSARRYDFQDDKGNSVQGVSLTYLTGDVEMDKDRRGASPLSINAPMEVWESVQEVPGVYDLDFKQRPGPKGRPTLQCVSVKFHTKADNLFVSFSGGTP